ncbi:MAG TPA: DOMON-like domain-containing protein [Allosphingosinicella sp.]|nr:DOMON-like domain-containing protein [Allosphingosinicella sp.]
MHLTLRPHPETPPSCAMSLHVDVARRASSLRLDYVLAGSGSVVVPAPAAPSFSDGLWRTTCFEAFVAGAVGEAYVELNLSPSGEWAAYAFAGYRAGMKRLADAAEPKIRRSTDGGRLRLHGSFALGGTPFLPPLEAWCLGLAAVIEEADGRKSYWAVAHPPGKPDFHHPDCFAVELPPPAVRL